MPLLARYFRNSAERASPARRELMERHLGSVESVRHHFDENGRLPQDPRLTKIVEEICTAENIPVPAHVGVVSRTEDGEEVVTASYYAAFRQKNRVLTVSTKAMQLLDSGDPKDEAELRSLVGHELGHAKENFRTALMDRAIFTGAWLRMPMSIMLLASGSELQPGEHRADKMAIKHGGRHGFARLFMRIQGQERTPKDRDQRWADFVKGATWIGRLIPAPLRRALGRLVRTHPPTEDRIARAVPDQAEQDQLRSELEGASRPPAATELSATPRHRQPDVADTNSMQELHPQTAAGGSRTRPATPEAQTEQPGAAPEAPERSTAAPELAGSRGLTGPSL
jgi:hypothetical protein